MEIGQYFDTTVSECESNRAVRIIAVPASSIDLRLRPGAADTAEVLGLDPLAWIESPAELIAILGSLVDRTGRATELAETCVMAPRVPLGEGGPQLVSLAAIGSSAGEFGEWVRLTAFGSLSVTLLSVPSGVVLAAEAGALSQALWNGLAERLRVLMGMGGNERPRGSGNAPRHAPGRAGRRGSQSGREQRGGRGRPGA